MSECVVRMEMPKNCINCDLRYECNAFYAPGKPKPFMKGCMIVCQLPEGHGRLVDADAMAKDLEYDCELDAIGLDDMTIVGHEREHLQFDKDCKQNYMWYLTEQETIVPAERSETEQV